VPINPTLPVDGESNWDVSLNAALDVIIDEVNAQETDIAAKLESVDIADINATGTPSGTTYLRGDGTWSTPAGGGGGAVDSVNGETGTVVLNQDEVGDGTTYKQYSATEKTKLAGVASGATANSSDATLLDRANHTGTQAASTIGSGTMATARLGSGTANSTSFLRGDQTWAVPAGTGGALGAMVYLNAATLTAATGARVVIMDTVEVADSGFSYNTTTGELTLTNAGWYSVFGHVRFNTSATGFSAAYLTVGGVPQISSTQLSASQSDLTAVGLDYFAASTVLKFEVNSGSSVQIQGGNRYRTCLRVVKFG
jgi:hypothetical protein